jgi:hypothetical protein
MTEVAVVEEMGKMPEPNMEAYGRMEEAVNGQRTTVNGRRHK